MKKPHLQVAGLAACFVSLVLVVSWRPAATGTPHWSVTFPAREYTIIGNSGPMACETLEVTYIGAEGDALGVTLGFAALAWQLQQDEYIVGTIEPCAVPLVRGGQGVVR